MSVYPCGHHMLFLCLTALLPFWYGKKNKLHLLYFSIILMVPPVNPNHSMLKKPQTPNRKQEWAPVKVYMSYAKWNAER